MLRWQWSHFKELSTAELYAILRLRQQVFIVEQQCPYPDADSKDLQSYHLCGWSEHEEDCGELLAYLRVLPPGLAYRELAMGRIVTAPQIRGDGLGRMLMAEGLRRVEAQFGNVPIRIGAQQYLKKFYEEFGFRQVGEPYDEDGIMHIEMLRTGSQDKR